MTLAPRLKRFAHEMRIKMTDAERRLWYYLKDDQLGFRILRQRPIDPYIVDFYCAERKLAIELDGGQHAEPEQKKYDEARTAYLNSRGIRVIRFWDTDVFKRTDDVLQEIWRKLREDVPPFAPRKEVETAEGRPGG